MFNAKRRYNNAMQQSTPSRRFREKLWLLIQVLALGAIVFSPFLTHESRRPSSEEEGAGDPHSAVILSITSGVRREVQPSITSRVVQLPVPASTSGSLPALDLDVETRQLRFERGATARASSGLRRPASIAPGADWELVAIRKRLEGQTWEDVELVRNDFHRTLGSVFVELDEGLNDFSVVYRSPRGQTVSYLVRVRHFRKNMT
jgi:hypothetical protein